MTRVLSANDCVRAESAESLRGGQTIVPRFGYGTMRLPGPGVWGPPRDPDAALAELSQAGLVHHIGVSNVTSDQLRAAQAVTAIASVENLYNARERASTSVLEACERDGLPFLPIPGTTSGVHLEENLAAAGLRLSADQIDRLTAVADQ